VEVKPEHATDFAKCFNENAVVGEVGKTVKEPRFRIAGMAGDWVVWASLDELQAAWLKPLAW
jgi:hypothetical protein